MTFYDATCAQVFGTCDAAHFNFNSQATAGAAAQALMDQVFLDTGLGAFDSVASLTLGCTNNTQVCAVMVPWTVTGTVLSAEDAANYAAGAGTDMVLHDGWPTNASTADYSTYAFARFTLAPPAVPEPATWAMMLLGFGGMGFAMRRQRQSLVEIA